MKNIKNVFARLAREKDLTADKFESLTRDQLQYRPQFLSAKDNDQTGIKRAIEQAPNAERIKRINGNLENLHIPPEVTVSRRK